jgi:PAS domain S-box-containing protein
LGVRAKLVVPIPKQTALWGLMIAHQCDRPREWSEFEVELLQQLANQVGIAIAQSQLLEALRVSEERFRLMADSAPVLLWICNLEGRCTFFNQGWLKFTGRALESAVGEAWGAEIHPEDLPGCLQAFNMKFAACERFTLEYRLRQADGEYCWVLDTGTPLFMPDGSFAGFIGSCIDISDRKQAEEEILKALIKEKELSELKSRFVSMTSHEFRTPLTTILSASELLEFYSDRWTAAEKVEQLRLIQCAVHRMTLLLEDVLLLGKGEAGKIPVKPVLLNLNQMCQSLVTELQRDTSGQYWLNFVCAAPCPTAYLDEKLLRQILTNLLSNAIKYSPGGGTIQLELSHEAETVAFEVKDQGIGIPLVDQPRLFESFHRASNVGALPGTGLGLAIVKKCVDLLAGRISVTSQMKGGTTFRVVLPLTYRPKDESQF